MCGPRSLRIRMWIGIWPPSKRARSFAPEREPAPFWPRPDVLPVPEPSPRPTRLRGLAAARGRSQVVQPDRSSGGRRRPLGLSHRPRPSRDGGRGGPCPRACGVSLTSTVWPMRRRPSERSVSSWRWSEPFLDLTCVTFMPAPRLVSATRPSGSGSASALRARRRSSRQRRPRPRCSPARPSTALTDRPRSSATSSGLAQPLQAGDRRLHEVDRVLRAQRLREDVVDARRARAPRGRRRRR